MNKKVMISYVGIFLFIVTGFTFLYFSKDKTSMQTNKMTATVLSTNAKEVTLQDENNAIYTIPVNDMKIDIGSKVVIEYTGLLDKNKQYQEVSIVNYKIETVSQDNTSVPTSWMDNGIFKTYYTLAQNKLNTLSLEQKIGQLFLVRYPGENAITDLKTYHFGGFVLFEKDFRDKTEQQVKNMLKELQDNASIPLLTAVDEEGGKVVRVSSNPNLAPTKFLSPRELYQQGGFETIKQDTITKSNLLKNLGLNVNLAPVVDVSTNPNDYMYGRSLGENSETTATYAKTVIEASKGTGVSYTLKHFPGYGPNQDTHTGSATDNRSYDDIKKNDLPPFKMGIEAGAEAVLVSHNIVQSIDSTTPASLSASVHNLLRNDMHFTGVIITDDLDMGAVASIDDATVKAILAGNDLIITTDYKGSINAVKQAINDGTISEELINKLSLQVLAWKYSKGLMIERLK